MNLRLHTTIAALASTALIAGLASTASAASGTVNLTVAKGGFVIGGSSGAGTLRFKRRTYPLVVGGMSGGFTFGGSEARLTGRIANIRRPTDIEGTYTSATGGAAIGYQGQQSITLSNERGAVLQLNGTQTGLMVNADLGGMSIQLQRR
jgi:hypothetical protein